jgi:hypothetical protein
MLKKNKTGVALAGLMMLSLAGCSRSSDEQAPLPDNEISDNYQAEPLPEPTPAVTPTPEAAPATDMNATAEALPPAAERSVDEQMNDDAFATGMTARSARDGSGERTRDQSSADEPATDGNFTGE